VNNKAPPAVRAEPNEDDWKTAEAVVLMLNPSNMNLYAAAKIIASYRAAIQDKKDA
jgi:hypothetical protein